MGLESETLRRMADLFAKHVCRKCGRPAVRMGRGRFYCDCHFPGGRSKKTVPRVCRCTVA